MKSSANWRRKCPSRRRVALLSVLFLYSLLGMLHAQTNCDEGASALDRVQLKGTTPADIFAKIMAKEAIFKQARENYAYTLDVTVQTLKGNVVDGEFRKILDIGFDDHGKRLETVAFSPASTLTRVIMTQQDFDNLRKQFSFALTEDERPKYHIVYAGRQHVDEIDAYVFDIEPRRLDRGERYFNGRIWADARDFQIVKTCGKEVATGPGNTQRNLTRRSVTYREQIDGVYWFPTYSRSDEVIQGDERIREIIKLTKYHRFDSKTKIRFAGEPPAPASPGKNPDNTPK